MQLVRLEERAQAGKDSHKQSPIAIVHESVEFIIRGTALDSKAAARDGRGSVSGSRTTAKRSTAAEESNDGVANSIIGIRPSRLKRCEPEYGPARVGVSKSQKGVADVRSRFAQFATVMAAVLICLFVLFVINQTAQIVALADRVSPAFGTVVLWTLLALYAAGIGVLVYQFGRLPRPLRPPADKDDPDFPRYITRLRARLRRNPLVEGMPLETEADVEAALNALGERADEVTRSTALQVFLTTAISQNGSLDALAVLAAQSRMVLQIARIYHQRPSVRDLLWLYGNVAMAALLARQIEEMDMTETIRPLVSSVVSSAVGAVPGMEAAATVFVQSVLAGSANAYVTLRVGVIAKRYSGSLTIPDAGAVRKAAFAEAIQMIPAVVNQGAKTVAGIITAAMKKTVVDSVKRVGTEAATKVSDVSKQIAGGAREAAASGMETVRKWRTAWPWRRGSAEDAGPAAEEQRAKPEGTTG